MAKKAKLNVKNLWETINIAAVVLLVVMSAVLALGISNLDENQRVLIERDIQQQLEINQLHECLDNGTTPCEHTD